MKIINQFKIASMTLLMAVIFTGCMDVLDKRDLNTISDQIWDDPVQATLYLNKLYQDNMPGRTLGDNSSLSDEIYGAVESATLLLYGFVTPNDIGAQTVLHKDNYSLIRKINIAVDGLKKSALDDSTKNVLLGQALFFRAWRYWEFVRLYGGVPMVMNTQDPYTEDLNVPRSKTSESIDLIIADLDQAIQGLPAQWLMTADKGRITKGAAAAFKGRILMNWASPMFNPENKAARWQRAYDANKAAIEILTAPNVGHALHPDFKTIFTVEVINNPEAIFYRRYNLSAGNEYVNNWEASIRPRTGGGSGSFAPTWNLVKAFPMSNGKLINDPASGYDSTYFWQNRDPRFYATIAYNGCVWEMAGKDNKTQWAYDRNYMENNTRPATGFYNRKASDPTVNRDNVSLTSTAWIEIRFAEVLLNFAECANEIGKTDEAVNYMKMIRQRAGIDAGSDGNFGIPANGSIVEIRELIMIERQVEFAFENKRYWDLRRRKMFREDLGPNTPKLNGTYRHGLFTGIRSPWTTVIRDKESPYNLWKRIDTAAFLGHIDINNSASYNTYFNTSLRVVESVVNNQQVSLNYLPLYDFFAVPSAVLRSSTAIKQTKGWIDGDFDPLVE